MGFTDIPYPIANLRVENNPAPSTVRIGWLRSVAHIHHAFAVQSFTDELAALAKADRVEYLLKLIGAAARDRSGRRRREGRASRTRSIRSTRRGCGA